MDKVVTKIARKERDKPVGYRAKAAGHVYIIGEECSGGGHYDGKTGIFSPHGWLDKTFRGMDAYEPIYKGDSVVIEITKTITF